MSVGDARTAPFVWQSCRTLQVIAERWGVSKPSPVTARSVYLALTEIGNEDRARVQLGADSEGFPATRKKIAAKAHCGTTSVEGVTVELERLGLLRIDRRREAGEHLPSVYTLLEPEPSLSLGVSHSAGYPSRPAGEGVPPSGSGVQEVEEPRSGEEVLRTPSPSPPPWHGKRVNRKPVTAAEWTLAGGILAAFNARAETSYTLDAHFVPIIGRIRERPDLILDHHRAIIRAAFAEPWWKDRPAPAVIYGNAGIFERSLELARKDRGNDAKWERFRGEAA